MRELFDEVAGHSPLDAEEAVRRTVRGPPRQRFHTQAAVAATPNGFAIRLDGKPVRTPSGRALVAPNREIAEAIAAEWDAQKEFLDPLTMPLTRFANSVVEAVVDRVDAVTEDIVKYLGSDLLFYRAGHPEALAAREAAFGTRCCSGRRTRLARISFSPRASCMCASPIRDRGGARGAAVRPWSSQRCSGDDADGIGTARAGAAAWRARFRPGLDRRACR